MAIDYLTSGVTLPKIGMDAVQGDPFMDMISKYQSASPEKKEAGLKKLAEQYPAGPEQVFGVNPTAPQQLPGQPAAKEPPDTAWGKFMDFASNNPQFLLDLGAQLLAPRDATVSPMSHVATGLQTATDRLQQRKAAEAKAGLEERRVGALEEQVSQAGERTQADIERSGAQTESIRRTTQSQGILDDLNKAKAELARAQARKTTATSQNKDAIYDRMMAKVLFKNNPDKYANEDEALEAWGKFKIDKGQTPEAKAFIQLMENLPYMDENRVQPTIDLISKEMSQQGQVDVGATRRRAEAAPPPIEKISDQQWLSLEGINMKERTEIERIYGKDVVAQKIAEAKAKIGR